MYIHRGTKIYFILASLSASVVQIQHYSAFLFEMSYIMCIRLIPVRMACPREGHSYGHNSTKVYNVLIVMYIGFFLSILAIEELICARVFMLVSTAGHVALFPLLHQPAGEILMLHVLCLKTGICHVHTSLACR